MTTPDRELADIDEDIARLTRCMNSLKTTINHLRRLRIKTANRLATTAPSTKFEVTTLENLSRIPKITETFQETRDTTLGPSKKGEIQEN